jgi:hypothetical protein
MDNFNEEEIQKKIEEKRKRFIENAHRALGFYDQNLMANSEEHKKRSELMEKEFNKVFDNNGKGGRRYDEEPAKPLILASSIYPENETASPSEEKTSKIVKEPKVTKNDTKAISDEEDSLMAAEREHDSKIKTSKLLKQDSKSSDTKAESLNQPSKKLSEVNKIYEEEKKIGAYEDQFVNNSKNKSKAKPKYKEESDDEYSSPDEYSASQRYMMPMTTIAKNKKVKKFVVNTRH